MTAALPRRAALLLIGVLACCVLAWRWPTLRAGSYWHLLFIAPLLTPLPGILRGQRYTFAWATLVVIAYIALGLTEVIATPASRLLPALILFSAFALLIVLVAFIRLTREPQP